MDAFIIILTATLFSISCGILGCFLILRKMAMVGDAISHAVLPGIVIAFLLSGSRDPIVMIFGAGVLGIFTSFVIEYFHKKARLQTDAAIGVTFTSLFAFGIILVSLYAGQVDLDQECVLYGEIAYVPIDLWVTSGGMNLGPRAIYIASFLLVFVLIFLLAGYRHLHLTTFDPSYAATIGISVSLWHYLLMAAVSMTTVSAFESVGAILVIALFVVPPATAYLLTEKLKEMLLITVLLSVFVSASGYYLAVLVNGSIAGAMVTVAGLVFGMVFLLRRKAR